MSCEGSSQSERRCKASSVRSAMFIEAGAPRTAQAPSGAAWKGATKTAGYQAANMPPLTELVSIENGCCYKHGAPNGAFAFPSFRLTEHVKESHRRVFLACGNPGMTLICVLRFTHHVSCLTPHA